MRCVRQQWEQVAQRALPPHMCQVRGSMRVILHSCNTWSRAHDVYRTRTEGDIVPRSATATSPAERHSPAPSISIRSDSQRFTAWL